MKTLRNRKLYFTGTEVRSTGLTKEKPKMASRLLRKGLDHLKSKEFREYLCR